MESASGRDRSTQAPSGDARGDDGDGSTLHVAAVDGLRAYAIVGIVLLHALIYSGGLSGTGISGSRILALGTVGNIVDAFFILSGFVLFLPVIVRGGDLGGKRNFLIRRAARLYPPYWLTLIVILVVLTAGLGLALPSFKQIAIEFSAMQVPARLLDASIPFGFRLDGVLWFVSVIVGFSIVFAFVARPYLRHPLIGLGLAAAVTIVWKEAGLHLSGLFTSIEGHHAPAWVVQLIVSEQLPGWAFSFGLGMTAAWGYFRLTRTRTREQLHRAAIWAAPFALAAMILSVYLFGHKAAPFPAPLAPTEARSTPFVIMLYSAALTALMAVVVLGPASLQRPFVNRPIRRFAELSYGVFLFHVLVATYLCIHVLDLPRNGSLGDVALFFAVMLGVSLAFAWLSQRLVERPARRWAQRVAAPKPPPRPTVSEGMRPVESVRA